MPEPLEYRNPRSATNASGRKFPKPGETAPQAVIPPQFDKLLTKSEDHAAVRAIEAALRRAQIAFHTISDGERAKRQVQLYVATANFHRSAEIATTIFARRAKVKKFPKPEVPNTGPDRQDWIDPGWF